MISLSAFADELEKVGARAGLKIIRRLIEKGDVAKAERLALTPGVLKKTRYGSQYAKDLGAGSEGVASRVVHHKKGITTRKLFNPSDEDQYATLHRERRIPGGISSKEAIKQKEEFNKALEGHSALPRQHGTATTPSGHRMHFTEEVKGPALESTLKEIAKEHKNAPPALKRKLQERFERLSDIPEDHPSMKSLQMAARQRGYRVGDLHPGNIVMKGDMPKVIDTVPLKGDQKFNDMVDRHRLNQMNANMPRRATGAEIKQQAFRQNLPAEDPRLNPNRAPTIADRKKALKQSRKEGPIAFPKDPPKRVAKEPAKEQEPKTLMDRMRDMILRRRAA